MISCDGRFVDDRQVVAAGETAAYVAGMAQESVSVMTRNTFALLAFVSCLIGASVHAGETGNARATVTTSETAFLDYLDAVGAVGYIESGGSARYDNRDLDAWTRLRDQRRQRLEKELSKVPFVRLEVDDQRAVAAMRRSLEELDSSATSADTREPVCSDARRRDLDYAALRAALVNCFVEHGNNLVAGTTTIDRGTALQLLHVVDDPAHRKAIFAAFQPLWHALNGDDEPDSPYRRMIALAALDAKQHGSQVDAAARAIGVQTSDVERWLVEILSAWRDSNPSDPIEPWDFRYVNGAANRQLQESIPGAALLPVTQRYYRKLGADLDQLRVIFDLAPRAGKSPLAYSDFLQRGRSEAGEWRRPIARVLGTYPEGGLFSLNELVHEAGHAVHVSAIHTRPAYMDWPDTLFSEAFADVTSWSIYEPAWQREYLGTAVPEAVSMRALFGDVMLDVAWALFELRMLREPAADPNAVWTDITHSYLRIVAHPEVPWWAMRVQLASDPGYMVNYGLGAVLTAEIRARANASLGSFDVGNGAWYGWTSDRLLRFGSERDTSSLMQSLLGREPTPAALLAQIRRCSASR